jgi:hypothetical protein
MTCRHRSVQDDRDQRLREMWGVVPRAKIAKALNFKHVANVSHRARHLGLPPLTRIASHVEGKRDITAAQKANADRRRKANAERRRELRRNAERRTNGSRPTAGTMVAKHAAQVARADALALKKNGPQPKYWRCSCGGICVTGPSHTQCEVAA